jgi:hypothetical protein
MESEPTVDMIKYMRNAGAGRFLAMVDTRSLNNTKNGVETFTGA